MTDTRGDGRHRCVVVGYDGSEAARAAVRYGARRAGPGGLLVPVYAFGPPPDWLGHPSYQQVLDSHRSRGQELLDSLSAEAIDLGGAEVEPELIAGHPAEALAKVAETRDADEIVVGSRGHGRVRATLGSVSHELLHLADRPVVVIPERLVEREGLRG